MICSLMSTDDTSDNSFGLGSSKGTSVTTVGNGNKAPTIDVASVLGTPGRVFFEFSKPSVYVYMIYLN